MSEDRPEPGEHMQRVFASRGIELTLEEARRFMETLLELYEMGVLVFHDAEGNSLEYGDEGWSPVQCPGT